MFRFPFGDEIIDMTVSCTDMDYLVQTIKTKFNF